MTKKDFLTAKERRNLEATDRDRWNMFARTQAIDENCYDMVSLVNMLIPRLIQADEEE